MPNKPWSPENAVPAFTAALSRAGYDREFRDRLAKSTDSAREAVSEEGEIDIAPDIVIVFHEKELNEKYHTFYLPPFDADQKDVRHEYLKYFQCCYNGWKPPVSS
ncbi:MAG: hypothetical protein QOF80_442 [Verrucomicrobiota bacterium]|jgi:hypothetical protein